MKKHLSGYGKRERLVLRHKKTGKISSNRNQGRLAIKLEVIKLTNGGFGDVIVSTLMPQTADEIEKLTKTASIYKVGKVNTRRSSADLKALRVNLPLFDVHLSNPIMRPF